jgi:hypothetical protein
VQECGVEFGPRGSAVRIQSGVQKTDVGAFAGQFNVVL